MQFEDQRTASRDANRVQDERLAILEPERLADIRCADEYEVALGERVVEESAAIVEIGNAGDNDLVRVRPFRYEVTLIAFARNTEHRVLPAQACDRSAGEPPREPGILPPRMEPEALGVCHPFLNEHNRTLANVPSDNQSGARDGQVEGS